MTFNRHEILKKKYVAEISEWNWPEILVQLDKLSKCDESCDIDVDGSRVAYLFIGTVFGVTPSGKVYAFWTSNQTRADETRDGAWWDAFEEVCEAHGCFVGSPENGDGDGVFIAKCFDPPMEDV